MHAKSISMRPNASKWTPTGPKEWYKKFWKHEKFVIFVADAEQDLLNQMAVQELEF